MNRVTHFEIPTDDKSKSKDFYSEVFEWQIADVPVQMGGGTGTYTIATTVATDPTTQMPTEPGAINGAIVERQGRITAPVITVTVDSIDDCLKKVTSAGGEIIESRQEIENMGYYAYVTDPAGNVIGLWEDAARS
jgi:predicted enzyme related to lactoylglutathione lyase